MTLRSRCGALIIILTSVASACRGNSGRTAQAEPSESPTPIEGERPASSLLQAAATETTPPAHPSPHPILRVNYSDHSVPRISTAGAATLLDLPAPLAKAIARDYSGFDVPREEDIAGPWAAKWRPGHVPFLAWGDYNGDGRIDIVTILFSSAQWRVVVFHRTDHEGYVSIPIGGAFDRDVNNPDNGQFGAEYHFLSTFPKGQEYTKQGYDENSEATTSKVVRYDVDTFTLFELEGSVTDYHWIGDGYEEQTSNYE